MVRKLGKSQPVLAIFAALILAGCSDGLAYRDFTGNGRGVSELRMDTAACQQEADIGYQSQIATGPRSNAKLAMGTLGTAMIVQQNAFNNCMTARGWDQTQTTQPNSQTVSGPKSIGKFDDWTAATHQESGTTVCYAFTRAQTSNPATPSRGAVIITITQRPTLRDAVAIDAGFRFAANAAVTVQVDQKRFDFYTDKRNAFARDGKAVVAAFQKGSRAIAQSPGPKDMPVTDIFSLRGFLPAFAAITRACPATF
jgi:hypothetical protein